MSGTVLFGKKLVRLGVAISSVILVAACVAFVVFTLSTAYTTTSTAAGVAPALAVENLLDRSDRLPPAGTQIAYRGGMLEWEVKPEASAQITDFEIQHVRLSSIPSFPSNLLDDDPVCKAEIEVVVLVADDQDVHLVIDLWEYALVTPWSLETTGDGWKPSQVHWPED